MRAALWAVLAAALTLGACGTVYRASYTVPPAVGAAYQDVIEAEADFATLAGKIGNTPAFSRFAAPGAIMFLPEPMVATDYLAKASWPGKIEWRPAFIGVASAGDLAVAIGPSQWTTDGQVDPGYYLTIWARQPDGAMKFVLDRGLTGTPDLYPGPASLPILAIAVPGAEAGVTPEGLEATLAAGLATDARAALISRLDNRGWVMRPGGAPASGPARAVLIGVDPPAVTSLFIGGGMSASRDLAWTYGETRWREGGADQRGHYVRVWIFDGRAWRILIDHQVARPPG